MLRMNSMSLCLARLAPPATVLASLAGFTNWLALKVCESYERLRDSSFLWFFDRRNRTAGRGCARMLGGPRLSRRSPSGSTDTLAAAAPL